MDFITAILLLVLVVWSPLILTRLPLVAGCLVFLLLANCFSIEFARFEVGPVTMSLDRIFLVVLVAAFFVQRRLLGTPPGLTRRLAWDDILLAGFAGLVAISTFMHDWRTPATSDIQIIQHLINGYLTPLVLFWVARQSVVSQRQLRWTYFAFVTFGVYLAVTGLLEVSRQWDFVFPRYIADPRLSLHFGRARGPMVHAVTFGTTLASGLICGWALWPQLRTRGRLVLAALAPLALAGLFYSFTRSVWLGTALAVTVVLVLTFRGWLRVGVLTTLALAGLVVSAVYLDRIVAFDRTDNTASQTQESVDARSSFAYVSWQMFLDHPLLGVGFGQFPREKLPYLADRSTELRLEAIRPMVHHNTYLSLLTELGLVGLSLYLAVLALWARGAWQLWNSSGPSWQRSQGLVMLAILALYAVQCLFHEMSFSARDHSLVFFFAGLTANLRPASKPASDCIAAGANWLFQPRAVRQSA
jgi:O-antigen ligase